MNAANDEKRIFNLAVVIADEAERNVYLLRACDGNEALQHAVNELLESHFGDGRFMARPVLEQNLDVPSPEDAVGQRIGPYLLLKCLGEGGFGVVYRARQESVGRDVALKVLRSGLFSERTRARFELERHALAIMDHANIAEVYDADTTSEGRPYFAMALVDGPPITQYCQQHWLSLDERLRLFRKVCEAVQHAHQNGVIHRDIKPTNVLVAQVDGEAIPKVIDFGIAKLVDHSASSITKSFELVGTPAYMSPEQTCGEKRVDTRSDVYSLGVLLYEMLTGATPFAGRSLPELGFAEVCRMVREVTTFPT